MDEHNTLCCVAEPEEPKNDVVAHIEMDILSDNRVRFKMEGDMKLSDLMELTKQTNPFGSLF